MVTGGPVVGVGWGTIVVVAICAMAAADKRVGNIKISCKWQVKQSLDLGRWREILIFINHTDYTWC